MLQEVTRVKQLRHEPVRRWFTSDDMDLVVWLDAAGTGTGFQLCYDKRRHERAVTWHRGQPLAHARVDDGENVGAGRGQARHKQTPVLIPDEAMPLPDILARFAAESAALPPALRQLVQQQLTTAGN